MLSKYIYNSNFDDFFKSTAVADVALSFPTVWTGGTASGQRPRWRRRDGMKLAAIGVGGSRGAYAQGTWIAMSASRHAKMAAVFDVDQVHCDECYAKFDRKLNTYSDYRELLEKEKPGIVTIGTPDHWHVPIANRPPTTRAGVRRRCARAAGFGRATPSARSLTGAYKPPGYNSTPPISW